MSPAQRAIAAHEAWIIAEKKKAAARAARTAWVQGARSELSLKVIGEREPCRICGRHRNLAQAHHLVPLSFQYAAGLKQPDNRYEWLCPTHHSAVHFWIGAIMARRDDPELLQGDFTSEEVLAVMQLAAVAMKILDGISEDDRAELFIDQVVE